MRSLHVLICVEVIHESQCHLSMSPASIGCGLFEKKASYKSPSSGFPVLGPANPSATGSMSIQSGIGLKRNHHGWAVGKPWCQRSNDAQTLGRLYRVLRLLPLTET